MSRDDMNRRSEAPGLDSIEEALSHMRRGRPIVVVDDAARENEGDLIMSASAVTPEWMGFIIRHSSGVVCAPMTTQRAATLGLPPMVVDNQDPKGTAYTLSCDAARDTTTGISAADRTRTVHVLADPGASSAELHRPGHVFPLVARPGGVRERAGHTEAGVEFARLAGAEPVAVIAEVVHDDGSMMRLHDLLRFGRRHGLAVVSIEDLVRYLDRRPSLGDARSAETAAVPLDGVGEGGAGQQGGDGQNGDEQVCTGTDPVRLPTPWGAFEARAWRVEGMEHLTLSAPSGDAAPLVRVHSECLTGDVLGSRRCDCGEQLTAALEHIAAHGGTLVYLRGHEGRGIGLFDKLRAYALQERGWDTVDANTRLSLPVDARDYAAAATILGALGCRRVRLLTNNPAKVSALEAHGIAVEQRVALQVPARDENAAYLRTKRERMSHLLTAPEASAPAAPPAPAVTCGPAYAASRRSVPEQTHRQTLTTTERTAL